MGCLQSKSASSSGSTSSTATTTAQSNVQKGQQAPLQYTWSYLAQKNKTPKEVDFSKLKAEDFLLSGFENSTVVRKEGYVG